jgi:hypothetical protein
MERMEILIQVKCRLEAEGYDGLYCPGECGCTLEDLAPCGECNTEDGEDWINGCEAGYKHIDPRSPFGDWVLSGSKEPPTPQEFDSVFASQ